MNHAVNILDEALTLKKMCVRQSGKHSPQAERCKEEISEIKEALTRLQTRKMTLDYFFVIIEKTSYGISIYKKELFFSKEDAEAEKPDGSEEKRYCVETLGYFISLDKYLRDDKT